MPTEIHELRRISFPLRAMPAAFAATPSALGLLAPPAEIEHVVIESLDPPMVEVTFRPLLSSPREHRLVPAAALAAVLISYSRRVGIPIPKASAKNIILDGDRVVLAIELHRLLAIEELARPAGA